MRIHISNEYGILHATVTPPFIKLKHIKNTPANSKVLFFSSSRSGEIWNLQFTINFVYVI